MPRKRILSIPLVLFIVLSFAGATLFLLTRPGPQVKVVVQFAGSTNSPTTYTTREGTFPVTIALFRITNLANRSIFQWPVSSFDAMNNSAESGINYGSPEFQGVLAPGQSKIVSVVAPWTIQGPWRAGFRFSRIDWRYKVASWPPWVQSTLRAIVSEKRLMMHDEEQILSDWAEIRRVLLAQPNHEIPGADTPPSTNLSPLLSAPRLDPSSTQPANSGTRSVPP